MDEPKKVVLTAFRAMNDHERKATLEELLDEFGVVDPERHADEMIGKAATIHVGEREDGAGKKGGGRRRGLYWLKEVTGWDDSKKKGFRLQGNFVTPFKCRDGTRLAMGMTTSEGKRYAIVEASESNRIAFTGPEGVGTVEVDGVRMIEGVFTTWDSFETALRR